MGAGPASWDEVIDEVIEQIDEVIEQIEACRLSRSLLNECPRVMHRVRVSH